MTARRVRVHRCVTWSLRPGLVALMSLSALVACAPDEATAPSSALLTTFKPAAAISDAAQGNGDATALSSGLGYHRQGSLSDR